MKGRNRTSLSRASPQGLIFGRVGETCALLATGMFRGGSCALERERTTTLIVPVEVPDLGFPTECQLDFVSMSHPVRAGPSSGDVCACRKNQTFALCWNAGLGVLGERRAHVRGRGLRRATGAVGTCTPGGSCSWLTARHLAMMLIGGRTDCLSPLHRNYR